MAFGLRRCWAKLSVQLVSKISNLCDPDPPTLQTDGRTDDMQSQYARFALHRAVKNRKNPGAKSFM